MPGEARSATAQPTWHAVGRSGSPAYGTSIGELSEVAGMIHLIGDDRAGPQGGRLLCES